MDQISFIHISSLNNTAWNKTEYRFLNTIDGWQQHGLTIVEEVDASFMADSSCLLVFNIIMTIHLRTSVLYEYQFESTYRKIVHITQA